MLKRSLLLALGLGLVSSVSIGLAGRYFPYSTTRDAITDTLSFPGGLMASLVYPEGVHTGGGAPNWGLLAAFFNFFIYTLFWYLSLQVLRYYVDWRLKRRAARF